MFPVSTKSGSSQVIAHVRQIADNKPVRAIVAKLDLMLSIPATVIADDGDKGRIGPHGRFKLSKVETRGAVAHQGDDGGLGLGNIGSKRIAGPARSHPKSR